MSIRIYAVERGEFLSFLGENHRSKVISIETMRWKDIEDILSKSGFDMTRVHLQPQATGELEVYIATKLGCTGIVIEKKTRKSEWVSPFGFATEETFKCCGVTYYLKGYPYANRDAKRIIPSYLPVGTTSTQDPS